MTVEEKAKAYDEALDRAIELYEKDSVFDSEKTLIRCIFPEFKESEDEKIRKALVDALNKNLGNGIEKYGTTLNAALTWLEKQGEQKQEWSEEDERICQCLIKDQEESLDEVRNDKYGHSEIISDLKEMYRERINWLKSLKERIKGKED